MDAADYDRHFKVIGKLCKAFDESTSELAAHQKRIAATVDQIANFEDTADAESLPGILVLAPSLGSWNSALNAGPTAIQNTMKSITSNYIATNDFIDDFTTPPTSRGAVAVLTAFAAEMTTDEKTLTTKDTTGLVNFFDTIADDTLSWSTEADETADYKDSVYVVDTIVA